MKIEDVERILNEYRELEHEAHSAKVRFWRTREGHTYRTDPSLYDEVTFDLEAGLMHFSDGFEDASDFPLYFLTDPDTAEARWVAEEDARKAAEAERLRLEREEYDRFCKEGRRKQYEKLKLEFGE